MSGAAFALALALLCLPRTSRRRVESLGLIVSMQRRVPVLPGVVVVAALLAMLVPPSAVAAGAIAAGTFELRRRRHLQRRHRTAESEALQGALEVLVGELRVGAHPAAALEVAAT